jgi:hypothetical protein
MESTFHLQGDEMTRIIWDGIRDKVKRGENVVSENRGSLCLYTMDQLKKWAEADECLVACTKALFHGSSS